MHGPPRLETVGIAEQWPCGDSGADLQDCHSLESEDCGESVTDSYKEMLQVLVGPDCACESDESLECSEESWLESVSDMRLISVNDDMPALDPEATLESSQRFHPEPEQGMQQGLLGYAMRARVLQEALESSEELDETPSVPEPYVDNRCSTLETRPPCSAKGIPHDEHGRPTSIGSYNHSIGKCKACWYVTTAQGCAMGERCNFCHLPHDKARWSVRARARQDNGRASSRRIQNSSAIHTLAETGFAEAKKQSKKHLLSL